MATITTRVQGDSPKGSPLTNAEVDNNFINLNDDKVEKSGDTLTGSLKTTDNTTFAPIFVDGGNVDAHVLRISSDASSYSGAHGFSLMYMGSRSTDDNSLSIFSDNQNAATQVEAIRIQQSGEVRFSEAPTVGGTAVTLVGHTHTLSEITDAGTAAAAATTDFATSAQGTLADSAVQPNDSPSFGSISVTGTVDGRDVAADGAKLDGIESGATADQTAAEILTAIKTVDGSGSGLDADLLDGVQGSSYLRSDASDTFTSLSGTSLTLGSGTTLQESTDRADLLQITSNTSGWGGLQIRNSSSEGRWSFMTDGSVAGIFDDENGDWHIQMTENAGVSLRYNNSTKLSTTSSGVSVTGTITATAFSGDGSSLTGIDAGATGGGSDKIFWENDQTVTTNYTISNGKNAMSAGPITINSGVTVTIGTGETWTVV